jgi:hypothetical protein
MGKQNILVIISAMLFSCANNADYNHKNKNITEEGQSGKNDTSLRKCILERDTLIDSENSIKYVIIDSFYTLKIQVGGLDTLLPYHFNCSVPRGLVPSFYSFYKNIICLIKGAGQHYREFTICYVNDDRIILKKYETALAADLKSDIVIYQSYDNPENIIVENITTENKKIFTIPSRYATLGISNALINKGKLQLKFSDGKVLSLNLPVQ